MVWLIIGVAAAIVVAFIAFVLFLKNAITNFDTFEEIENVDFHDSEHKPII